MNILVVALDNLGDVVMASSVAGALRQIIPESRVSFWVKAYSAPVLEFCPEADTVFGTNPFWEASRLHPRGSLAEVLRTISSIRRRRYEAALILSAEWRRSLFCWGAGIPRRVGLDQRKSRFFLAQPIAPSPPEGKTHHVLEEHRRLVGAFLGHPIEPLVPRLKLSTNLRNIAEAFFNSPQSSTKVRVGIHPFCGNPVRQWPASRFIEFCRQVLAHPDRRVVAFGSREERGELESWKRVLGEGFLLPPETLGLKENLAVLSLCHAFVGLDSGFSHAAAAFGVPTLALFGPSDPDRFRPVGPGLVRIIRRDPLAALEAREALVELLQNLTRFSS
jgi:ADP-heptose:LPS heptosyltransferase